MIKLIVYLLQLILRPTFGLGKNLFHIISSLTPMVNVDLLIVKNKRVLLSWRHDQFYGPGWHIPGGVIRFREKLESRIRKVAINELKRSIILVSSKPLLINELFAKNRNVRGHFISLLYECDIDNNDFPLFEENNVYKNMKNGDCMWHQKVPIDFLVNQKVYKDIINEKISTKQ